MRKEGLKIRVNNLQRIEKVLLRVHQLNRGKRDTSDTSLFVGFPTSINALNCMLSRSQFTFNYPAVVRRASLIRFSLERIEGSLRQKIFMWNTRDNFQRVLLFLPRRDSPSRRLIKYAAGAFNTSRVNCFNLCASCTRTPVGGDIRIEKRSGNLCAPPL